MRVHFVRRHVIDTAVILEEWKLLPPTVHPMRHDGPPEGLERVAPEHSTV